MGSNPAAPTDSPTVTTPLTTPAPKFLHLFCVALVARLGTVALGSALATLPPDPYSDPNTPTTYLAELQATARPLEAWFRFDANWHVHIARNGYREAQGHSEGKAGPAFLPIVPGIMVAAEALGINLFWASVCCANLAGATGAAVFARVAARQLGDPAAAWRALALLLAFPTAFFLSAAYHESFGLLFGALVLAAWRADRCAPAGVFAFLGSLSRLSGVSFGLAALVDWLVTRERATLRRALWVALGSFAGIAAFWCFLWIVVGDPFAGLKMHRQWGRHPLSWRNPLRTLESVNDPLVPHYGEAVVVLGVVLLGIRAWRARGAFWGVLTLAPVAQMFASGTLLSAHRVVLACLPAFIELADLARGRRLFFAVTIIVFVYAQFVLLNRYVHWQFAG